MAPGDRPLSPHLQIYRPQITSVMSILHRLTGIGLWVGALLLTFLVGSATYGPEAFNRVQELIESWFGQLVLLGLTVAVYYHLANGIRHLAWDIGWGYEIKRLKYTGLIVIWFTGIMTAITFLVGYRMAGVI
tara:strand:+ start:647 stop:1042 length:396 start_codon:yes stop_codon:yes gene_type:complete